MGLFDNALRAIKGDKPSKIDIERNRFIQNGFPYKVDDDFTLYDDHIIYKRKNLNFLDVKSMSLTWAQATSNFIKLYDQFDLNISFDNNELVRYYNDKCNSKGDVIERYQLAFQYISEKTFKIRMDKIVNQIIQTGYISIPKTEVKIFGKNVITNVKIYGDGFVIHENIKINLKYNCNIGKGLSSRYGADRFSNPNFISIRSFTPENKIIDTIEFDLVDNRDCYIALLKWLVEPNNVIKKDV